MQNCRTMAALLLGILKHMEKDGALVVLHQLRPRCMEGAICRFVYLHAEQSEGKKGADHRGWHLPMGGGADEGSEHSATRAAVRMEASSSAARGR